MRLLEIVDVIKKNPHIKKISIEGHASSEGDAAFNKKLSGDRAKSVMTYLVDKGIPKESLQSKGFGSEKPIASNDTEDGKEKNRRRQRMRWHRSSSTHGCVHKDIVRFVRIPAS